MHQKWLRRIAVVIVAGSTAIASTSVFAESASAATTGVVKVSGTTVVFTAAAGAVNSVIVTSTERTVTVDDRVAVKAGKGCKAVKRDKTKVRCTPKKRPKAIKVSLGDRNDQFVDQNKGYYPLFATVSGGAGDDRLTTISDTAVLTGDAGNDRLTGG